MSMDILKEVMAFAIVLLTMIVKIIDVGSLFKKKNVAPATVAMDTARSAFSRADGFGKFAFLLGVCANCICYPFLIYHLWSLWDAGVDRAVTFSEAAYIALVAVFIVILSRIPRLG